MEIVILDSLTLGKDADLSGFKKFGTVKIFDTTKPNELFSRVKNANIIISNKVFIGKEVFEFANKLKMICVAATGYNNVNINAAKDRGIVVANVRNYSTESVVQHTFSLILSIENSLFNYLKATRNGNWSNSPVFNMLNYPFCEISGKTIGIIGYGTIGKRIAEVAKSFGMKVLIGKRKGITYNDVERVDLEVLLRDSDIISIHTPLSENTKNMFSISEFKKMKKSAILINAARGGILNEKDLYEALTSGYIRAAATDVTEQEPIEPDNKLIDLKNMYITPHIAWASFESRKRLIDGIIKNIDKFIAGDTDSINLAK